MLDLAVTRDSILCMICHIYSIRKKEEVIEETISASALANANTEICGENYMLK